MEAILKEEPDLTKIEEKYAKFVPLIQICLAKNPKSRPTAVQLIKNEVLISEELPSGFSSVSFSQDESPHSWLGKFDLHGDLQSALDRNSQEQFEQMEEFIKNIQHGEDLLLQKHRALSMTASSSLFSPVHSESYRRLSITNEALDKNFEAKFSKIE